MFWVTTLSCKQEGFSCWESRAGNNPRDHEREVMGSLLVLFRDEGLVGGLGDKPLRSWGILGTSGECVWSRPACQLMLSSKWSKWRFTAWPLDCQVNSYAHQIHLVEFVLTTGNTVELGRCVTYEWGLEIWSCVNDRIWDKCHPWWGTFSFSSDGDTDDQCRLGKPRHPQQ